MPREMKVNRFAGVGGEQYELRHEWPEDCFVQGGHSGVVLGNATKPGYKTAYFEAFPDVFIRGEGPTLEEAEDVCWAKYERQTSCPGHEYEPRGYKNGGGWCKHCNQFKGKVFTPEDLGLKCKDCGVWTYWSRVDDDFYCELHAPVRNDDDISDRWRMDHPDECDDHDEVCCLRHGTHSNPHVGCILR
jgi:hypothetical protein